MEALYVAIAGIVGVIAGAAGCFFAVRSQSKSAIASAKSLSESSQRQLAQFELQSKTAAEQLGRQAELKAKEDLFRQRETLSKEFENKQAELRETERRLEKRELNIEKSQESLQQKDRQVESQMRKLNDKTEAAAKKEQEMAGVVAEQLNRLQEISGLSREGAERQLLERVEHQLTDRLAKRLHKFEAELKENCEAKSREIVLSAIQRYASDHTSQAVVSTVDIPSDDVKGRIIGREGRNIRTFEKAAGVDVIVDDTPGVVIVSAFDNVRRETARLALLALIQDGRIHPTRIEEIVKETQTKMEKHILEVGKAAAEEAGVSPLHEKLCQLLGRLKFRTSYSQNVLNHSIEVAHLCGMMASELGLNAALARRCGLLHDIGKAADHEMEGGHPKIGADLAKRFGENNPDVLHAIAGHHDDVTIGHVYTVLVAAADAISAARPGARRETLDKYIRRLEQLEQVAHGFPQVEHAYAIQAGRELRVIANANRTTDDEAKKICHDIARAIEEQLDYPGEIKVTVVRETRAVETAK